MEPFTGNLRKITVFKTTDSSRLEQIRAIKIGPTNLLCTPFYSNLNAYNYIQGVKKRLVHAFYKKHFAYFKTKDGPIPPTWEARDRFIQSLPKLEIYKQLDEFVKTEIIPKIPELPPHQHDSNELEDWLSTYDRNEARKNQIRNAYEQITESGGILQKRDIKCKVFAKNEAYEEKKHARMICPRYDRVLAALGPYIHEAEEAIFHHSEFSKYFIKGLTPEEQVERIASTFSENGVFVESDYSSFEGSFTQPYQHVVEVQIFRKLFKHDPLILKNLELLYRETRLRAPFFQIDTVGSRMSGDLWTSLMNGMSNLVNILFLCHLKGIRLVAGLVEGDDGLFEFERRCLREEDFLTLGFKIKMDYQNDISSCSFCQKIFNPVTHHLLGPPELLNRIGWTSQRIYFKAPRKIHIDLLCMKAFSYLLLYPSCPIISVCMKKILEYYNWTPDKINRNILCATQPWYHKWILKAKEIPNSNITIEDRILYHERFGITISQQLYHESLFDGHSDFSIRIDMDSYDEGVHYIATESLP